MLHPDAREIVLVSYCYIKKDCRTQPLNIIVWAGMSKDSWSLLHMAAAGLAGRLAVTLPLQSSLTCLASGAGC